MCSCFNNFLFEVRIQKLLYRFHVIYYSLSKSLTQGFIIQDFQGGGGGGGGCDDLVLNFKKEISPDAHCFWLCCVVS